MRMVSDFALAVVTLWQEARGEPNVGKIAVGEVIRNRMKKGNCGVADVVLKPSQFSGWGNYDPNRIPSVQIDDTDPVVVDCASAWLASEDTNMTNGADHYFNPKTVAPSWYNDSIPHVQIGNHIFCSVP